jgi:hypothetical protein
MFVITIFFNFLVCKVNLLLVDSYEFKSAAILRRCTKRHYNTVSSKKDSNVIEESWIAKIGEESKILTDSVTLKYFDDGLRGMIATNDVVPKQTVVAVPADLAIQVTNDRPPSPLMDFVPQDIWEKSLWDQRLALKLLMELKKIIPSNKQEWFLQLPKEFSTPLHWDNSMISELQYSSLSQKINQQKESWKFYYEKWKESTDEKYRNEISFDDM